MPSMSVSLFDKMRGFIKSRVESGDYHNEIEYIRDLIRRDQERLSNEDALEHALLAAEAGGFVLTSAQDIKNEVKQRLKADGRI